MRPIFDRLIPATSVISLAALLAACSTRPFQMPPAGTPAPWSTAAANCMFTPNASDDTLIIGPTLLSSGEVRVVGTLLADGKIKEIGSPANMQTKYQRVNLVQCRHVLITPGLVNAHEHTAYSFAPPRFLHRGFGLCAFDAMPAQNLRPSIPLAQKARRVLFASIELGASDAADS